MSDDMATIPGMFQSWREALIKLSLAAVFFVSIGSLVLWAMGKIQFVGR